MAAAVGEAEAVQGRPRRALIQLGQQGKPLQLRPSADHLSIVLTDKPNIIIARPPRRIRGKSRTAAVPARIVVGDETETMTGEHRQRGEAAGRLFADIRRAVNKPKRSA